MNSLNLLYDVLEDKINMQIFYNKALLDSVNPSARQLFQKLRDEETAHVLLLRQKVTSIETTPIPVNLILPALPSQPEFHS